MTIPPFFLEPRSLLERECRGAESESSCAEPSRLLRVRRGAVRGKESRKVRRGCADWGAARASLRTVTRAGRDAPDSTLDVGRASEAAHLAAACAHPPPAPPRRHGGPDDAPGPASRRQQARLARRTHGCERSAALSPPALMRALARLLAAATCSAPPPHLALSRLRFRSRFPPETPFSSSAGAAALVSERLALQDARRQEALQPDRRRVRARSRWRRRSRSRKRALPICSRLPRARAISLAPSPRRLPPDASAAPPARPRVPAPPRRRDLRVRVAPRGRQPEPVLR